MGSTRRKRLRRSGPLAGREISADASGLLVEAAQQIAHFGCWRWELASNRVTWSDELYRIYGLTPDAFAATFEGYLGLVHPDDRERVTTLIRQTATEGGQFAFEERIVRPGGEVRVLQSQGRADRDEHGRVRSLLGVCHDITERRHAEERLRRSEARMTEAQAIAHLGSWEWEPADDKVTWSDELYRIYGVDPLGFGASYQAFLERVHPDDRPGMDATVKRSFDRREPFSVFHRVVRPDGEVRTLHARGDVVLDGRGEVVRMVGTGQDVTELRRAETAAREAELRFRSAFDNAPIGVGLIAVRGDGAFLDVNRSLCRITGHRLEALRAMTLLELVHPEDVEAHRLLIDTLRHTEEDSLSAQTRLLHADGRIIWGEVSASLVRDPAGHPSYGIVQVQDITERKQFEVQLQYLAEHDPLTGLFNRRRFIQELDRRVALLRRYGGEAAVLVVDLDRFKFVNDTLGHAVGDDLIRQVASILRRRVRETDVLARLGGDEFAVLLPVADGRQAMRMAGELLEHVRREAVVLDRQRSMRLTASIGISLCDKDDDASGEAVLVNADLAMYQAKEAGRDRIELLETIEEPQTRMRVRLTWADRLRDALEHERFVLYQQPILDLRRGEVAGSELLLRLPGEDGDMIPPGTFLYIAEEFGMMPAIDSWVIRQAVRLIGERAGEPLTLAVNLSGASITDAGVLQLVEDEVTSSGIDPRSLIFEVTETAAIVNVEKANRFAGRIAELGCSFALDDFGAGFGSFYYLKHLPFDYLKIDGDFVRHLPSSTTDQLTVKALVEIAHGLSKKTIAEFVEDEETLRLLRRYGVDLAQGYHIAPPAPVAQGWPAVNRVARAAP